MKNLLILFAVITLVSCCGPEELSLERIDYLDQDIQMHGFYYNIPDFQYFILYQNGVLIKGGGESLSSIEDYFSDLQNYENIYELPYAWGIFQKDTGNNLLFEGWRSSDGGGGYPVIEWEGSILNDTTLLINHPAQSIGLDHFHFHPMLSKPDSTNQWTN